MMIKIFLSVIILLPMVAFAQNKADNTIIVKGVSFENAVSMLLDGGFTVDKIDKDFKTVKTEYKEDKKYSFKYSYDIRVKDSTAIIKGKWLNDGYTFDIQNIKGKADQILFSMMDNFARSLNGKVEYAKQ